MGDVASRIVDHYERHALSWDADRRAAGWIDKPFIERFHGEAVGSYRGDPLYHASLDASEYEKLLADFGFERIEHSINDPAKGGRIFWLARAVHE
jgi:hypothetical protein